MPSSSRVRARGRVVSNDEGQAPICGLGPRRARQRLLSGLLFPEGDHTWDLPLGPHLVDFRLEVVDVLFDEVGEAPLLEQVLAHGLARPALDAGLGLALVPPAAVPA